MASHESATSLPTSAHKVRAPPGPNPPVPNVPGFTPRCAARAGARTSDSAEEATSELKPCRVLSVSRRPDVFARPRLPIRVLTPSSTDEDHLTEACFSPTRSTTHLRRPVSRLPMASTPMKRRQLPHVAAANPLPPKLLINEAAHLPQGAQVTASCALTKRATHAGWFACLSTPLLRLTNALHLA